MTAFLYDAVEKWHLVSMLAFLVLALVSGFQTAFRTGSSKSIRCCCLVCVDVGSLICSRPWNVKFCL